jgi:hypothetical protein
VFGTVRNRLMPALEDFGPLNEPAVWEVVIHMKIKNFW